ncbi:hypothetical protein C7212DRAFT_345262 [Tuber magnatum]|uniref:Uncharacterized protein n=1 Tax=Tuber magnatum TaxID=42249 RepID=A0A317SMW2_9PEZI|nr:hypothetical protein C7212DRAFT_345262 [Tuber magnatum]
MAFNLARQLSFRKGFIPHHRATHFPRKFGHTAQRKVIDELIGEVLTKHEAPKMSELERLASLETEMGIHRKAINDGFSRIEGWIKLMVSGAGGTILFGFGGYPQLIYKVMVYDIQMTKEMKEHLEKVFTAAQKKVEDKLEQVEKVSTAAKRKTKEKLKQVEKVITAAEKKTDDKLEHLRRYSAKVL